MLKGSALEQAQRVAEQLRLKIEQAQFSAGTQAASVTVSIGVSQYDGTESCEEAIGRADAGLYAAKNGGRNASAWPLLFKPRHSTRVVVPTPEVWLAG